MKGNIMDTIKRSGVIISGFDIMDVISLVQSHTKKYQATLLSQVEIILGNDSDKFLEIRKLFLDESNNFSRSVVKSIFGDIEY